MAQMAQRHSGTEGNLAQQTANYGSKKENYRMSKVVVWKVLGTLSFENHSNKGTP